VASVAPKVLLLVCETYVAVLRQLSDKSSNPRAPPENSPCLFVPVRLVVRVRVQGHQCRVPGQASLVLDELRIHGYRYRVCARECDYVICIA
jgi:hypothetical protein